MVEKIDDMPAGTIGFRASGKLTPEDYRDVLVPTLREAVEAGEVRMLFVLSDFEELDRDELAWRKIGKTKAGRKMPSVITGHRPKRRRCSRRRSRR